MAGALFAFFPNVWFFGGGAFSDIPSIVLVLFAVTLLFRGARDRKAYWLGTLLLALAIGIRPQNFLLGLIPGILRDAQATADGSARRARHRRGRRRRRVRRRGLRHGRARRLRAHRARAWAVHLRVDSWRSAERPPLWRIFDRFFIKQYQSAPLSIVASLLAMVSMVGAIRERDHSMLWAALTFIPFALLAWLMLDRFSISRFSIGYQPMFALFVADGIRRVGSSRRWLAPTLAGALIAAFATFTLPALTDVRNEVAPSILAARAVTEHVDPTKDRLFVGHTMSAFMDLVVPGFPYTRVLDDRAMPLTSGDRPSWLLAEITESKPDGLLFRRERGNLWNIARRHYFEIKLQPLREQPRFVSGWYSPEGMGRTNGDGCADTPSRCFLPRPAGRSCASTSEFPPR